MNAEELTIVARTYKQGDKLDEVFLEEELSMGNYRIVKEESCTTNTT